jgi:hypothetical protein
MSKTSWDKFLAKIDEIDNKLDKNGCVDPFYRGHSNSRWALYPSLARRENKCYIESRIHNMFMSMGGHLMPNDTCCWEYLFYMQQYGLPTRLLDWTENFAAALYFSIKNNNHGGAIWILDPYALNQLSLKEETVISYEFFKKDYCDYFNIEDSGVYGKFPADVVAMQGTFKSSRMRSQRSVFTFHSNLEAPLEKLFPDVVHKVLLPLDVINDAKKYLRLFGTNEFTLFPDLDGLCRYIKEIECY